ncbi:kinase [Klebsiella quasipneumoniae]|nr:kinase [Klebsiella quasipneumoniae]
MLGWCHDFGDHIILSDDIPTGKTQSCLIEAMIYDFQEITLHVTEPLDWSYRESPLLDTVSGRSTIIANAHAATGR